MVVDESQPPPRQQVVTITTGTHSYHFFSTYYVTGIMPSTLCTISTNTQQPYEAGTINYSHFTDNPTEAQRMLSGLSKTTELMKTSD